MSLFGKKEVREQTPEEQRKSEVELIMGRYKDKLKQDLRSPTLEPSLEIKPITTKEYQEFRKQYMPSHFSWYETACGISEKLLKVTPDKKKIVDYEEAIAICHLNVTPAGTASFAILLPMLIALIGGMASFMLLESLFFTLFFLIIA